MSSIDALARAIKEYEGGVVIVSHDFRMFRRLPIVLHTRQLSSGLISQVANELWEVKNRRIRNLSREDISIVDYKRMLVQNSASPGLYGVTYQLTDKRRFRRTGESQAIQQDRCQGQDVNARQLRVCTPSLPYPVMSVVRSSCPPVFRFCHYRLDCFNTLVHMFYTDICDASGSFPQNLQNPDHWAYVKGMLSHPLRAPS